MSLTSRAFIFKFFIFFSFSIFTLRMLDGNSWALVFLFALVSTVVAILLGDLVLLPAFGNIIGSIGDGLLVGLLAYIFNLIFREFKFSLSTIITLAILIAIGEFFFHEYLLASKKVAP